MSERQTDQLEGLDVPLGGGVVALPSGAIMDDIRNVAGRVESGVKKEAYRESGFAPGQVETVDFPSQSDPILSAASRVDRELGFPAHSVIVDNPTKLWLWIAPAQRFACPGLMNAVWQIPKASTKADIVARAPAGVVQAAVGTALQATLTFCEAWLMPTPGIISNAGGV